MAEAVARALGGSAAGWRQNQLAEYYTRAMAEAVARALGGSAAGWRQNQLAEYSILVPWLKPWHGLWAALPPAGGKTN